MPETNVPAWLSLGFVVLFGTLAAIWTWYVQPKQRDYDELKRENERLEREVSRLRRRIDAMMALMIQAGVWDRNTIAREMRDADDERDRDRRL